MTGKMPVLLCKWYHSCDAWRPSASSQGWAALQLALPGSLSFALDLVQARSNRRGLARRKRAHDLHAARRTYGRRPDAARRGCGMARSEARLGRHAVARDPEASARRRHQGPHARPGEEEARRGRDQGRHGGRLDVGAPVVRHSLYLWRPRRPSALLASFEERHSHEVRHEYSEVRQERVSGVGGVLRTSRPHEVRHGIESVLDLTALVCLDDPRIDFAAGPERCSDCRSTAASPAPRRRSPSRPRISTPANRWSKASRARRQPPPPFRRGRTPELSPPYTLLGPPRGKGRRVGHPSEISRGFTTT